MRLFPIQSDQFKHEFGIRPLPSDERIIEQTECYAKELKLKRQLLADDVDYYYQSLPETELAQQEAAKLVFENAPFLQQKTSWEEIQRGQSPLLEIGKLVQEDLVVLGGDAVEDFPVLAGLVCFPSGWCISDKLAKSVTSTHIPVPEFASQLADSTSKLMKQLKANRSVWRSNWGVRPTSQLDQSPRHADWLDSQLNLVTAKNAGERCFFRVERQTLSRLERSNAILFTIHTHQCRLNELSRSEQTRLLKVLLSCPEGILKYKGIFKITNEVNSYLGQSIQSEAS